MKIYPKSLCFLTTRKCTAACENCCFGCSPNETAFLPVDRMHTYLDQALELPSIRIVVFSGGECFLLGGKLDELVKHASENSLSTRFVSNGYWATSKSVARKRLEHLVECGLKEANFSTGDNHMKYVNPRNIQIAAIESVRLGMTPYIVVELFKNSSFPVEDFLADKEFRDFVESGKIILSTGIWMKTNSVSKIKYSENIKDNVCSSRCDSIYTHLSINPYSQVGLCCGLTIEPFPELYAGILSDDVSIKQLLDALPTDFIKLWIRMRGPREILDYARKYDKSIPTCENKLHICDLCREVYSNPNVRNVIMEHIPRFKNFVIESFYQEEAMESLSMAHRGKTVANLLLDNETKGFLKKRDKINSFKKAFE